MAAVLCCATRCDALQVLSGAEQRHLLKLVGRMRELGAQGQLVGRTYTAPARNRPGNGRVTVQLGCCYNYAADREGNPPGILPAERVCGLPPLLLDVVERMERRGIFGAARHPTRVAPASVLSCSPSAFAAPLFQGTRPDSAIINFYSEGDCIPPHIDHHDFARPFVTLSLLSEQATS